MRKKPKAVDLFAGAGGLTEGLRQAGYIVLGAVELDPLACAAYKLNHKKVKLWEQDIAQLSGGEMMRELGIERGELDLLAACPPCQGYSTIRTRNGATQKRDFRNALIQEVLRLVRSVSPKNVMMENVPGLASSKRFQDFVRALKRLGYLVNWNILNTADYGVPQRRKRLVLLASKYGEPHFAGESSYYKTVRQHIGKMPPPENSRDPLHNYKVERSKKVEEIIRRIPRDGGSRTSLSEKYQLKCHKDTAGFFDVYGRMSWDSPSPTITGGCINPSKGRFLHPDQNRAITLREAALLQTFPKGYKFPLDRGRYPAALLIGNALPPEFIKRHALTLRPFTSFASL